VSIAALALALALPLAIAATVIPAAQVSAATAASRRVDGIGHSMYHHKLGKLPNLQ
jgi:hypothetical protein